MGSFPGSPSTLRGAIVAVDRRSPLSRIVIFQYNPDEVTRSLRPRGAPSEETGSADAHRIWGAPIEQIRMTVEVDATDQLETQDPVAAVSGIAPQLSAMEMLLYPSSVTVIANATLFPIRASVALSAQVLTYDDLAVTDAGSALFLVHQVLKETMATVAGVTGAISAVQEPAGG
jgi:hypothetical protein